MTIIARQKIYAEFMIKMYDTHIKLLESILVREGILLFGFWMYSQMALFVAFALDCCFKVAVPKILRETVFPLKSHKDRVGLKTSKKDV